jgi:hypothetical protein
MSNRIILSGMLLFTAACVTQALNAQGTPVPASTTLVCQGTRINGTPFTFPFLANTSPAPTLGAVCVPNGKKMPKGKSVMGTAPKASKVFAVVFVPSSTTGGTSNTNQPPAPPAGTTPPAPPAIQAGIANLRNAKANLQNAGDKWGDHRANAIKDIDQALNVCGLPQTTGNGEMKSGYTDITSLMTAATEQLTQAQTEFKNAKNPWGGRRDSALTFIAEAVQELKLATTAANAPK